MDNMAHMRSLHKMRLRLYLPLPASRRVSLRASSGQLLQAGN